MESAEQKARVIAGGEGFLLAALAPRHSEKSPTLAHFSPSPPTTALWVPTHPRKEFSRASQSLHGADLVVMVWARLGCATGRTWPRGRRFLREWVGYRVSGGGPVGRGTTEFLS